jgi:hypothetical protein
MDWDKAIALGFVVLACICVWKGKIGMALFASIVAVGCAA